MSGVHDTVARYYAERLRRFGATPAGVDWRDAASQRTRFEQLCKVVTDRQGSAIDLGCGYGALLAYLREQGFSGAYHGLDVAPEMIEAARVTHKDDPQASFEVSSAPSHTADYLIASGIFNVRQHYTTPEWEEYIAATLADMDRASLKGFAFNSLTTYSDRDMMRDDLYYADPYRYFDLCKRLYSRQVALLHDYDLYEFTVIVRKG
jgi:SAM-dependent methyltransferase